MVWGGSPRSKYGAGICTIPLLALHRVARKRGRSGVVLFVQKVGGDLVGLPIGPAEVPVGEPQFLGAQVHRLEVEHAAVRDHLARTSEDDLRREVAAREPTRFPQGSHRPIDCYRLVLREEWWHHRFAERDLSVVEAGI